MLVKYPKNFLKSRNKKIIDLCKGKKVLHIWASDAPHTKNKFNTIWWPLLYQEIDRVCWEQLWVDLDRESIDFLTQHGSHFPNSKIIQFDMNQFEHLDYSPEVIVFWEVIEHLMNLETALSHVKKLMSPETLLIISTPNCYGFSHILRSCIGREVMHEDHKVFFSYGYLKNLLLFNTLSTQEAYFTELDDYLIQKRNIFWKIEVLLSKLFPYNKGTLLFICKNDIS